MNDRLTSESNPLMRSEESCRRPSGDARSSFFSKSRASRSVPISLPKPVMDMTVQLIRSGMGYPFSRISYPEKVDYELRARARIFFDGDRPDVAGLTAPDSRCTSWQRLNGYHTAAGVYTHVVPSTGPAGIILPLSADILRDDTGRFPFRRKRIPAGGRVSTVGIGISAGRGFGRFAALSALQGSLDGRIVNLRANRIWTSKRLFLALKDCPGLFDVSRGSLGVKVRVCLQIPETVLKFATGDFPVQANLWGVEFYEGVREVLSVERPFRPKTIDVKRLGTVLRLAAGAGMQWRIYSDGRLSIFDSPKGYIDVRDCRIEKVMLPIRASWPTCEGLSIHPSGIVYDLKPGTPFEDVH